jgi:ABC-type antimicrobial peptide transport system permease subunit
MKRSVTIGIVVGALAGLAFAFLVGNILSRDHWYRPQQEWTVVSFVAFVLGPPAVIVGAIIGGIAGMRD